ncbi:MAG: RNA binding S1 domain protein [Candidatus Giovannonibacteria bacterium GW2011_GWA2_53_7]|uniref:RNA binding S1 domain protein n=1 Tax=Candidatus Giovannonibacteria bacterium GW2011_GWA2_53_7 TaxID=1618650 RepID=A0A0G1XSI0_9BACT|nr:MAG: RNA binding S1 domain protein [Candidatus Giovannonibacteria bacterium GW2011_GWA2_53_7]
MPQKSVNLAEFSEFEISRKKSGLMEELFKKIPVSLPKVGELVESKYLGRKGTKVFLDLDPYGSGIIFGNEFFLARDLIKNLKPGEKVTAKVVELEGEDGCVELSLREAGADLIWKEAEELAKKKEILSLTVLDANKGGLVLEWKKIKGFLPASQLKIGHYPRVEGGDKSRILDELRKFIGTELGVTILAFDPREAKIIFSEKGAESDEMKELAANYKAGDIIEGEITGVVDFGVFIKLQEGLEGLCHLSELDWSLVENPAERFKVGERVKAKIISIESGRVSLSAKALKPDPWMPAAEKYRKGDIVEGKVLRFNKYGALVSIEEGVAGLCHISEFGSVDKMREKLEVGKTCPFQITLFEPKERRLTLSYLGDEASGAKSGAKKETPPQPA